MADDNQTLPALRALLAEAASLFRHYESLHRAKGPGHEEKVARNAEIAGRIECALDGTVPAGTGGPPVDWIEAYGAFSTENPSADSYAYFAAGCRYGVALTSKRVSPAP